MLEESRAQADTKISFLYQRNPGSPHRTCPWIQDLRNSTISNHASPCQRLAWAAIHSSRYSSFQFRPTVLKRPPLEQFPAPRCQMKRGFSQVARIGITC